MTVHGKTRVEEWQKRVERWRESGLTADQYAGEAGINAGTLKYWRYRLNKLAIEPLSYIRDLFCLLPSWPKSRVLDLAPAYWKQTFQQRETQEKLAANVFRRVLLDLPA